MNVGPSTPSDLGRALRSGGSCIGVLLLFSLTLGTVGGE